MEHEGSNFTKGEAQNNRNERDVVDHGVVLDPATIPKRFDGALKGRLARLQWDFYTVHVS